MVSLDQKLKKMPKRSERRLQVKHQNWQKHAKIDSTTIVELLCAKKPAKKHQIFKKIKRF